MHCERAWTQKRVVFESNVFYALLVSCYLLPWTRTVFNDNCCLPYWRLVLFTFRKTICCWIFFCNCDIDKTFPWICIKKEPFPRVFSTRNVIRDGSLYYGPYTSAYAVRVLLTLIRQLYQLRTCKHALTAENISSKKFKVCLEYHIGNCLGPCEGLQDAA